MYGYYIYYIEFRRNESDDDDEACHIIRTADHLWEFMKHVN